MARNDLRQVLAAIVRQQAARGPLPSFSQNASVANAILSPHVKPYDTTPVAHTDIRGPSLINRILDIASRPLYTMMNPIKEFVEELDESDPENIGDIIEAAVRKPPTPNFRPVAAWEGLSGRAKTTGADVLEASGEPPGFRRAALGLGMDITLDPLSYVGAGLIKQIGKGALKSVGALRNVEEVSQRASQEIAQDIARSAAQSAEAVPSSVPTGVPPRPSIPARGQVQEPSRTFAAGPGRGVPDLSLPALEAGPLGRARSLGTKQLDLPVPKSFVPFDAPAISAIKAAVTRGVPLEQAALRPLIPQERTILERGLQAGTSSRKLEQALAQATGRAPQKPFTGRPRPEIENTPEQTTRISILEAQRARILAKIDDLEAQISGTASSEVIAAETRRLETRLQQVTPELRQIRQQIDSTTNPEERARLTRQFEDLNNEREQLLQRTAAQTEEGLEASTIGPAGETRTIVNSEINQLEAQARKLGSQIEEVKRTPATPPTAQTVTKAGETIATPVPKLPETVAELLTEASGTGINWRRMAQRQATGIPLDASRLDVIRFLEVQRAATRSPVFKNMIGTQIKKLREGVTPAALVDAASLKPPAAPKITLSRARLDRAATIGTEFARVSKFDEINHVGQTNLYNRIANWALKNKVPEKGRASVIYQMLRIAEDRVLEAGKKLVDAEGLSVRLSDVVTLAGGSRALTPKFIDTFRKAKPNQALENAKALSETGVAEQVIDPIMKTARDIAKGTREAGVPPSRTVQLGNDLSRELQTIARQAGASAREAKTAKDFVSEIFNPSKDQLYSDVMQEARALIRQTMTGKVDAHLTNRISKATYDALRANPKVLGKAAEQTRVVEAIMMRFATWWNAKDLRPFAREYIDTARNVAAAFERALTPLIRSTTPSQRAQAWRVAQGKISAGTPVEKTLSDRFRYLMEKLVGAEDVTSSRAVAESVLVRSGTTMDELNKALPKKFQFKDTKGADDIGREFNYSDGKWMHSWREWDVVEPSEALYQVTRAVQLVTRKNSMLDDAAARWAVPVKGGEFSHSVDIPRLDGHFFPREIADQLKSVWSRIESDKFYHGGSFLQMFDKIQRMWKTGVTIYSPSHHIRNLNGDIFLSALDGVVGVNSYRKSLQVLHAFKGHYRDIENVFNIMDPKLRDIAMKSRPGNVIVRTKSGHTMTAEQVFQAAESQGFMLRAATLEDLVGGESAFGTFGQRFAPFGGRVHQTAAKASELRDHFVRLAHFIDVLNKSKTKNLRDAIEIAGRRVKKFHPDGSDMTGFEQSVMRRIIPFYSWLRKATPLVIEGAIMRPHVSLLFPKIMANMQEITGIESQGPGNPFPTDQMFPDWIKEKGIGPIIPAPPHFLSGIGRQETWRGDAPGYVVVNPTNPLIDQITEFSHPKQSLLSNLTPFGRIPIELLTEQNALGIPLREVEGGTPGYLAQQVPAVGIGARITGMTRPDEPYHPEQLTNFLVSGGLITGTGPYKSQAQFEIRDLLTEMGRKQREARK